MPAQRQRGSEAEREACDYLAVRGLVPLVRNYRSPYGEIDLVMRDGDTLVFVEVRLRRAGRFGGAAETVDARKQRKLRATAEHFLQRTQGYRQCRFDVVAITDSDGRRFEWLKNAFGF